MPRVLISLLVAFVAVANQCARAEKHVSTAVTALPRAHAHNDYYHDRPLLDALDHGFCSIEADVFLIDGKLLVGHNRWELKPKRTLEALYLDPLLQRTKKNRGWIFEENQTITLLVDIKAEGEATYLALHELLKPYREMLSQVKQGTYHRRAVEVVLSGDRPRKLVAAQAERYVFLDGRIQEMSGTNDPTLVPLISENWNSHFSWRAQRPILPDEQKKLRRLIREAHEQGCRLRFWATPELPDFWQVLAEEGVDLIGTDNLGKLEKFWRDRKEPSADMRESSGKEHQ